jgi:hypothetical protein
MRANPRKTERTEVVVWPMIEFMSYVTFEFAASAVSTASRPEVPYRELHASASVDGESAIICGDVATG